MPVDGWRKVLYLTLGYQRGQLMHRFPPKYVKMDPRVFFEPRLREGKLSRLIASFNSEEIPLGRCGPVYCTFHLVFINY